MGYGCLQGDILAFFPADRFGPRSLMISERITDFAALQALRPQWQKWRRALAEKVLPT